jgi:hypothetical protein
MRKSSLVAVVAAGGILAAVIILRTPRLCGAQVAPVPGEPVTQGSVIDGVTKTIADTIEENDLFVEATVLSVGEPFWNSPDGEDWTDLYNRDPRSFVVGPIVIVPLRVRIDDVLHAKPGSPPSVVAGNTCEVMTLGTSLRAGNRRVFFLSWEDMYLSDGSRPVWFTDESQATWLLGNGWASPAAPHQAKALAVAIRRGLVDGRIDPGSGSGSLRLSTLATLIVRETRATGPQVPAFSELERGAPTP